MLNNPVWLQRLIKIAMLAAVYATGVWSDLLRGRRPDFFDPQTAIVALFFAYILAEFVLQAAQHAPKKALAALLFMAVVGVLFADLALAVPGFLTGMITAPFGGFAMVRSVLEGLVFSLRQAFVPALVSGGVAGLIAGALLLRLRAM
jgi:pilus assembly protein TadC